MGGTVSLSICESVAKYLSRSKQTILAKRYSVDLLRDPAYYAARVEGALAQLGERHNGIVEVSGSIPLGSTNILTHYFYKYIKNITLSYFLLLL